MSLVDEIHACFGKTGAVVNIGFGNQAANILWNFGWDWICPRFLHLFSPACGKAAQPCYRIYLLLTAVEQGSAQGAPLGRGKAVLLCRFRAGEGMSRSAVVGQGKGCFTLPPSDENGLSLAPAARNVRAAVCFLGRSLPSGKPHPAAASERTVPCAFAGRFRRRPSFCRTVRRRGNDSFSKLS